MSKKQKTLSVHKAYFADGYNGSLENIFRHMFSSISNAEDRIVVKDLISNRLFAALEDAPTVDGIFVRIFDFEQGPIGAINLKNKDNQAIIEEFKHPNQQDFLKEEVVLLISKNRIVACNLGNKCSRLAHDILNISYKANILEKNTKMRIADIPDQNTLQKLQQYGVKEISLPVTSYLNSLDMKLLGGTDLFKKIFSKPDQQDSVRKRANAMGRLKLTRGKFQKDEIPKDEWLTAIGVDLLKEGADEAFTIELEDGNKIKNSDFSKSKSVKLNKYANGYCFDNAKLELESYYLALKNDGGLGD